MDTLRHRYAPGKRRELFVRSKCGISSSLIPMNTADSRSRFRVVAARLGLGACGAALGAVMVMVWGARNSPTGIPKQPGGTAEDIGTSSLPAADSLKPEHRRPIRQDTRPMPQEIASETPDTDAQEIVATAPTVHPVQVERERFLRETADFEWKRRAEPLLQGSLETYYGGPERSRRCTFRGASSG